MIGLAAPALGVAVLGAPSAALAAERARIEAFLNVTGFDVALDSIALAAGDAPVMLGFEPDDFGAEWKLLADEVFDTTQMRAMALEILEATLGDAQLTHAAAFYASDLGQRLVVAENASHMMEDDTEKQRQGREMVAGMVQEGASRVALLNRMNTAIDSSGTSLRALQEIQFRFLMAASAAGVIELKMDADELRAMLKRSEAALRLAIRESALASAAYTYRDFSDADLVAYAEALEHPDMQQVYELLNAVQYEIMANRFELLAARMAGLQPGQDI